MKKQEFLEELRLGLVGLPQEDIMARMAFYAEMIEDRKEEGLLEEEAIQDIGRVEDIVRQTLEETSFGKLVKERVRPKKRWSAATVTLLAIGSPLWLSLLLAAFAVALSLYVSLWSVVVSLWATFGALAGGALGGVACGAVFLCLGRPFFGSAAIGVGLACGGLAILAFFGCLAVTKGVVCLTRKGVLWAKRCLVKGGRENE